MELLEKNLKSLQEEMEAVNADIVKAIGGEDDLDLFRLRDRKQNLSLSIPIAEAKILRARIKSLQDQRRDAKVKLTQVQPILKAAAENWREKMDQQAQAWEEHQRIALEAYKYDQVYKDSYEEIASLKRQLADLISLVVSGPNDRKETQGN